MGAVTVDELAEVMADAGKPIGRAALRYHCRDPRGALYGKAYVSGRQWLIPVSDADAFAAAYSRYGTLRKEQRPGGPPPPGRCRS